MKSYLAGVLVSASILTCASAAFGHHRRPRVVYAPRVVVGPRVVVRAPARYYRPRVHVRAPGVSVSVGRRGVRVGVGRW